MNIENKRLFLLDMDGTIYLGNRLFDWTLPFLEFIDKIGGEYIFFTNNSSKSKSQYLDKLAKMGIAADDSQLVTSTCAAIAYLGEHHGGQRIFPLGTAAFAAELAASGIEIGGECADVLVLAYDTELTYQKIEIACKILRGGAAFIATNPDMVCPGEDGDLPDCGCIAQMLECATGRRPVYTGKPAPIMPRLALARSKFAPTETLLIGDRLYTDIACGNAANIDTALVLTGEATLEAAKTSPHQPTFIFNNLLDIQREMWNNGKDGIVKI